MTGPYPLTRRLTLARILLLVVPAIAGALVLVRWRDAFALDDMSDASVAVCPARAEIAFPAVGAGSRDLYTLNLTTGRVVRMERTATYDTSPCYTRDSSSIVYAAGDTWDGSLRLWRRSLVAGTTVPLTDVLGKRDERPVCLDDNKTVLFARSDRRRWYRALPFSTIWDSWDLFCVPLEGGSARRVTSAGFYAIERPHLSVHRSDLAYFAAETVDDDAPAGYSLLVSQSVDSRMERLGSQRIDVACGRRFVWWIGGPKVKISQAGGGTEKVCSGLTDVRPGIDCSPDGEWLVCLRGNGSFRGLWGVSAITGEAFELAEAWLFHQPLSWRPSPKQISGMRRVARSWTTPNRNGVIPE